MVEREAGSGRQRSVATHVLWAGHTPSTQNPQSVARAAANDGLTAPRPGARRASPAGSGFGSGLLRYRSRSMGCSRFTASTFSRCASTVLPVSDVEALHTRCTYFAFGAPDSASEWKSQLLDNQILVQTLGSVHWLSVCMPGSARHTLRLYGCTHFDFLATVTKKPT